MGLCVVFRIAFVLSCASFFAAWPCFAVSPAEIIQLFRKNKNIPPNQFFALLPEELRANYALPYASRNLAQHASPDAPRIINYSSNGRVYVASTGHSNLKGGDTFELIFQDKRGNFKPMTARFTPGLGWAIDRHPKNCSSCHGIPFRPIWDAYPFWPGVYGSDHDQTSFGRRLQDPEFKQISREHKSLERFLSKNANSGRYAYLPGLAQADYVSLSNLNFYLSDVTEAAVSRQVAGRLLKHPEFWKFREWIYKRFHDPLFLAEKLDTGFEDLHEVDLDKMRQSYSDNVRKQKAQTQEYLQDVRRRFDQLDPQIPRDFGRAKLIHDDVVARFPAIEAMFEQLQIPETNVSTRLQTLQYFLGTRRDPLVGLWSEASRADRAPKRKLNFDPVEDFLQSYRPNAAACVTKVKNALQEALKQ